MNPLVRLLRELSRGGFRLSLEGTNLAVEPASRLSAEMDAEIRRFKCELMELVSLLPLYHDAPSWPRPRGRSGSSGVGDFAVGDSVRLLDGREGLIKATLYDTRSGRVRYRVELPGAGALLIDPEDLAPPLHAHGPEQAEGRS